MRKNSLTRQVRRAYDQGELARICTLREDRFGRAFGMRTVKADVRPSAWSRSDRPEDYYHFRDNNSSVLAVAHLDTVVSQKGRTPHFRNTENGPLIVSGALDDRLGAYVILRLLPKLGVTCDWLFTVGEESGASTAEYFDAEGKKYDWVIEFDRGSSRDVVMYQYEDRASRRLVEASGAEMGHGSFSDIAYLEHLDVKAFNWGVGYGGDYHSERGYAYLNDTFAMVGKYLRFHEQNAGTRMPHEARRYDSGSYSLGYGKPENDCYYECVSCGEKAVDSVTWYCEACGICQDCGATDPDVAADWSDPDVDVCQCYAPKQRGTGDPDDRDWREMDWDAYCALRPAARDDDALKDAWQKAQAKDGPGTLISAAPPWSEHRPVSHGLGVPTDRKNAQLTTRFGQARSAVNPPAVFPDADLGWHAAAEHGADGLHVVAHTPGQNWAQICLRCAARWPHPVSNPGKDDDLNWHAGTSKSGNGSTYVAGHLANGRAGTLLGCLRCAALNSDGSADIHPESDCPGCDRCQAGEIQTRGQRTIHVIPAHLAGESDICGLCRDRNAALSEIDRGDNLELETS